MAIKFFLELFYIAKGKSIIFFSQAGCCGKIWRWEWKNVTLEGGSWCVLITTKGTAKAEQNHIVHLESSQTAWHDPLSDWLDFVTAWHLRRKILLVIPTVAVALTWGYLPSGSFQRGYSSHLVFKNFVLICHKNLHFLLEMFCHDMERLTNDSKPKFKVFLTGWKNWNWLFDVD